MKEKLQRLLPSRRKLMQLYFALLFNINLKGYSTGQIYKGATKNFCVPGINCYSCPGAVGACPLGSLQGAFSSDAKSTLFYVGGILLLYCVMFGRMICGWLCPFGLIQELLYKIKVPKLKKSPVTRLLSLLKYVILVFFVFIVPVTYAVRDLPLPAFCKYICPAGTIEGGLLLLINENNSSFLSMLGPLFTWKFVLMISIVVTSLYVFRMFCRFLCPLGALYGIFNKLSVFGIRLEESKCIDCGKCISKCKLDIAKVGDRECISCGECVPVCPTGAIVWKGPKVLSWGQGSDRKKTVSRSICAALMLALLIGAGAYYWVTAPDALPPVGTAPGSLCHGEALEIVTGTGVTGETLNPVGSGRITVINFWGTWCGPCVNELPYFDAIAEKYGEQVLVVAVHSSMARDTAPAFVAQTYPDTDIVFLRDYDKDGITGAYYTALGGLGAYPYTLILDGNGVITHSFVSSVTYAQLEQAVEENLP